MILINYINKSKNMLDVSILSADKYITNDLKLKEFLFNDVTIEAKSDGIKLTVVKVADNGNLNDYIFAYKNKILYQHEFDYQPNTKIKKESISNSQFRLVFNHFEKLGKTNIPIGTELQIEFLMRKPTLSSNYTKPHQMVLIGYSNSTYTAKFGKLKTQNSGMQTTFRDNYAKELKINTPLVLFKGILGSPETFRQGIKLTTLKDIFEQNKNTINWANLKSLYTSLKDIFLMVPSKFGGKEEGVVIKYNDIILKWQQSYQLDQNARALIKQKYKEDTVELEDQYWNNVKRVSLEIANSINVEKIEDALSVLSNSLKRLKLDFKHSKKTDTNIKDDIQLTTKQLLIKKIKGNNNCLIIGKFRVLTNGHVKLIKTALSEYDNVCLCLVSSKANEETKELRNKMLELCFKNKISIINNSNANLLRIFEKAPFNINIVFCGSDRVNDYQKQLKTMLGTAVREMFRTNDDISATKVIEKLNDEKFFKKNTPVQIHSLYDELKKAWIIE